MSEPRSSGVRREFRVVYRLRHGLELGPFLTVDVVAFTAAAARAQVDGDDVKVTAVEELRPLLDPSKPWLSKEEAALRTGKGMRTIERWVELSLLPKCDGGQPMWTPRAIDQAAAKSVGLKLTEEGDLKAA